MSYIKTYVYQISNFHFSHITLSGYKKEISRIERVIYMRYNIFENDDLDEEMKKGIKENLIKKKHKNKISETNGQWRTRLKDAKSGRLTAKSYDELIEKLYDYYYEPDIQIKTFKEYAYEWINVRYKSQIISHNTMTHYRDDYKKYIEPLPISCKRIDKIKKSELILMFEQIVGDGSQILKKTLSNIKTVVNGAFTYAYSIDDVECIDAKRISVTDIKRKCHQNDNSDKVYSDKEISSLLQYISTLKPSVYTLSVMFFCCIPARISELRAITWEDVDFKKKVVHLQHMIVDKKTEDVNRKATDVDYMKAHSPAGKRDIKLSTFAINILILIKDINGNKKYVFNSKGKMPITIDNFNEHLKKYCISCGIEYKSSHAIRYYNCSKMYELGIDEKTIQSQMGHSSLAMTRHYDRRKPKDVSDKQIETLYGYSLPDNIISFKKAQ